jgi:hypothetical protein
MRKIVLPSRCLPWPFSRYPPRRTRPRLRSGGAHVRMTGIDCLAILGRIKKRDQAGLPAVQGGYRQDAHGRRRHNQRLAIGPV